MNKKLFLIALPAMLVLSSCNGLSNQPAQKDVELFKESTVNEEIFGAAEEAGDLGLKKFSPLKLSPLTSDFVKIGYQMKFDEGNDVQDGADSDDKVSIRFVAAIKDANVTAFWKRGLAQSNGYVGASPDGEHWKFKFEEAAKESTKIYTSLNNGGDVLTAGEGGTEGYTQFAGFVIYTLTNIPYLEYLNSYLAAYVVLTDASDAENHIGSQGLAVKVEMDGNVSSNKFYFDPSATGHFLAGTINGVVRDGSDDSTHKLLREDETTVDSEDNYASYSNIDLIGTDMFESFYYSPTVFQYFGFDSFARKSRGFLQGVTGPEAVGMPYARPHTAGNYNFYLKNKKNPSEENYMYSYANSYVTNPENLIFYPGPWDVDGAVFRLYCFNATENTWVSPSDSATIKGKKVFVFTFDSSTYTGFIFVRKSSSGAENSWDGKWNQTDDLSYDFVKTAGSSTVWRITAAGDNNQDVISFAEFTD